MAFYPPNSGGGGGGGPITGLTGTPTEVVYIDNSGNGTGDSLFTRDIDTHYTFIGDMIGDVMGGFVIQDAGIPSYGLTIQNETKQQIGSLQFIDGNGGDINGITLFAPIQDESTGSYTYFARNTYTTVSVVGIPSSDVLISQIAGELGQIDTFTDTQTLFATQSGNTANKSFMQFTDVSQQYPVANRYSGVEARQNGVVDYITDTREWSLQHTNPADAVQSSITFTGSGLDDISVSGTYTSTQTGFYEVEVIGNNGARLGYSSINGNFEVGDTVTGSLSGATGTVASPGSNRVLVYDVVGTFVTGDVLSNGSGVTTSGLSSVQFSGLDVFKITVTGNQATEDNSPNIGYTVGQTLPDIAGITVSFASSTGHTPGDTWSFSENVTYEKLIKSDATRTTIRNGLAYKVISTDVSIPITENVHVVMVDTSTNAVTLDLPNPTEPMELIIKDSTGDANTRNITIDGNGNTIDGSATKTISSNYGFLTLLWNNTEWSIIGN